LDFLIHHIEALIFCSPDPLHPQDLRQCLSDMFEAEVPINDIEEALTSLSHKYDSENFAFSIVKSGGGYQFLTKPAYQSSISILLKHKSKKRLSNSALETLSIIAYKQPITKGEIEQLRGVNSDYAVQKLLEKQLIEIAGKSDSIGRPILYATSERFMDYFGINSLKDLPTPKDFKSDDNEIGLTEEENNTEGENTEQ
jgi:segregation and condensation protein B